VATGIVVGSILLASDKLFRVEQLAVSSQANLINDGGFEIHKDGSWDVLAGASLGKEGVEGVVVSSNGLV